MSFVRFNVNGKDDDGPGEAVIASKSLNCCQLDGRNGERDVNKFPVDSAQILGVERTYGTKTASSTEVGIPERDRFWIGSEQAARLLVQKSGWLRIAGSRRRKKDRRNFGFGNFGSTSHCLTTETDDFPCFVGNSAEVPQKALKNIDLICGETRAIPEEGPQNPSFHQFRRCIIDVEDKRRGIDGCGGADLIRSFPLLVDLRLLSNGPVFVASPAQMEGYDAQPGRVSSADI
ncbi:hypothetical protein C8R45DRAFT_922762 [Mycena sanguinolenta]|nr:hypothetical protein C8R45DRAFT_922762 [Mycena sanguinolenta]